MAPVVSTRSKTFSTRVSSGMRPPSPLNILFRWKPLAIFCSRVASGSRSPASCSIEKRSKGWFVFSAFTTQSRHGHIVRSGSPWKPLVSA